jgi:hypothetical protein
LRDGNRNDAAALVGVQPGARTAILDTALPRSANYQRFGQGGYLSVPTLRLRKRFNSPLASLSKTATGSRTSPQAMRRLKT